MSPKTIAHTRFDIERLLRLRLTPRTDNRKALIELGFTPAYPHLATDAYYGGLWTRAIDAHDGSRTSRGAHTRTLVVERAFHVSAKRRPRRLVLRSAKCCAAVRTPSRTYTPLRARRFAGAARVRPAEKKARATETSGAGP